MQNMGGEGYFSTLLIRWCGELVFTSMFSPFPFLLTAGMDNLSPDTTPEVIRNCGPKFKNGIEDIETILDYTSWLQPFMTKHALKLYGTGDKTQHVFQFLRRQGGVNPGSVVVSYKKYVSDKVVEVTPVAASEGDGKGYYGAPEHRFRVNTFSSEAWLPLPHEPQVKLLTALPTGAPSRCPNSPWEGDKELAEILATVSSARSVQITPEARDAWQAFAARVKRWMRGNYRPYEQRLTLLDDLRHQVDGRLLTCKSSRGSGICVSRDEFLASVAKEVSFCNSSELLLRLLHFPSISCSLLSGGRIATASARARGWHVNG